MARRTSERIFLDELTYMASSPPVKVSSKALRTAHKWNEERYDKVRRQLIEGGVIKGVVGGAGGSLELLTGASDLAAEQKEDQGLAPVTAFISYSHADAKLTSDLQKHLIPLKRLGLIGDWCDQEISPGAEWDKVIATKLAKADLVLLLISADFIASEFCYEKRIRQGVGATRCQKDGRNSSYSSTLPVDRTSLWKTSGVAGWSETCDGLGTS